MRLASELTGYKLNMMLESEYLERQASETQSYVELFYDRLEVDKDLAQALVEVGFTSIEEVAYVPVDAFEEIDGLEIEDIELIQARAKEVIINDELAKQQNQPQPSDELLALEDMTSDIAYALAKRHCHGGRFGRTSNF